MERKIAFILRDSDRYRQSEFTRSALGLLLEGHTVNLFIINVELKKNPYILENLEWIVDSDGKVYSNNEKNADEFTEIISLEDMAKKMLENDFIVPF
jgi:hypothetical protein